MDLIFLEKICQKFDTLSEIFQKIYVLRFKVVSNEKILKNYENITNKIPHRTFLENIEKFWQFDPQNLLKITFYCIFKKKFLAGFVILWVMKSQICVVGTLPIYGRPPEYLWFSSTPWDLFDIFCYSFFNIHVFSWTKLAYETKEEILQVRQVKILYPNFDKNWGLVEKNSSDISTFLRQEHMLQLIGSDLFVYSFLMKFSPG